MKYEKFSSYYDKIFPFNQTQAEFISEYIENNDLILELGCGTGALANYISEKCQSIVAIDNDQSMVTAAIEKYPEIDFRTLDINEISEVVGKYNVIYSIGNTLSYLTISELKILCQNVFNMLETGGRWIYQGVNWDSYAQYKTYKYQDIETENLVFSRDYLFRDGNSVDFHLKLVNEADVIFDEIHKMYWLDCASHIEMNTNTGFIHTGCYLNWKKEPWVPGKAGSMILIFEKNGKTL